MSKFNKRTRRWEVEHLSDEQMDSLEGLPGLDVLRPTRTATGYPDAVAAAVRRLGHDDVPPHPPPSYISKWPTEDLRSYQREGISLIHSILSQYGGALLADDMGLGKTRQAAVVAHLLGGRKLIVCPAAVRETWRKELSNLGVSPESVSILGPPSMGKRYRGDWERVHESEWVVSSYELQERAIQEGFRGYKYPRVLVVDEMHSVRGRKTARSTSVEQLARMTMYRLGLTGSPLFNRPRDLYQQMKILHGQRAWGTPFMFDFTYCDGKHNEHGGWENKGCSNQDELRERLSYYNIRREKKDVAGELPALTRHVQWLDPIDSATRAMNAFILKTATLTDALTVALHEKREEAMRLATEAGRFLLCTWMIKEAQFLWATLNKAGVACNLITGKVDTKTRQKLIIDAADNGKGIVATTDSIGVGVDGLQHVASVGIFHALDPVSMRIRQTEDRLNRLGQKDPVTWYYIVIKNSADELVMRNMLDKMGPISNIVGDTATEKMHSDMARDATASAEEELRRMYAEASYD